MSADEENDRLRLLVVARRPFHVDELGVGERNDVERVDLVRRVNQIETAVDECKPNLVLVDTSYPDGAGYEAIGQVIALPFRSKPP